MARILVLDDEPMIAMMIEDWLLELNHQVVGPASTVAQALALIESSVPDAAILDVSIAGGHSFPVADVLRRGGVRYAFLTGHGAGSIDAAHADAPLLTKPFDFEGLKRVVARLLPTSA
jgi:DNA-binding response OmpR family regulator